MVWYVIEALLILAVDDTSKYNFFLFRIIFGIISKKALFLIKQIIFYYFIQHFYIKIIREFWALYDTNKKKFLFYKDLYENYVHPIIIYRIKTKSVIYVNQSGTALLKQFMLFKKDNFSTVENNRERIENFVNVKWLQEEIEYCLEKGYTSFDFPFIKDDTSLTKVKLENFPSFYKGNIEGAY